MDQETQRCIRCGFTGPHYTKPRPTDPDQDVLYCGKCNGWIKWLSKKKNEQPKRPRLKNGTIDEVWADSENHCAHCNLSSEHIDLLGLQKTVQHVPAYKDSGHSGYLIPLCSWCQQHSASRMKQLESMIKRLSEKFSF